MKMIEIDRSEKWEGYVLLCSEEVDDLYKIIHSNCLKEEVEVDNDNGSNIIWEGTKEELITLAFHNRFSNEYLLGDLYRRICVARRRMPDGEIR